MRVLAVLTWLLWPLSAIGWIVNLIDVLKDIPYEAGIQTYEALQIVGIFLAPLGVIMGWIDIFR